MRVAVPPEEALPGLATASDEDAMKEYLQAALFGTERPEYLVERATPTRPLWDPGRSCLLRYRFRATRRGREEALEPIVSGRVFANRRTCTAYMRNRLAPLVARMRGRPDVTAYAAPAAMIEPLNMVVYVWPLDGELPALVDATDPDRMLDVFRETLPEALERSFEVEDCEIELVSYRRRQRCVLRYTVSGAEAGRDDPRRLIAYGKVSAVGNETAKDVILGALRRGIAEHGGPDGFTVPRSLGWRPDLQLSLLEALAGEARIGAALAARLSGEPRAAGVGLPLGEMVATCGRVAAALHTSGVTLGTARTLGDELGIVQREVARIRPFVPALGERAQAWLDRIATLAERSQALPLCLSHGDYKYEQLLFDGSRSALVDFDAVCQAEPALDLGKYVAHLRVEAHRLQPQGPLPSALCDELVQRFLRAYVDWTGGQVEDERRLTERTALYEAVALLRLTLFGQQNLDETRMNVATALLEERLSSIARQLDWS